MELDTTKFCEICQSETVSIFDVTITVKVIACSQDHADMILNKVLLKGLWEDEGEI